jgi:hypothetical protein
LLPGVGGGGGRISVLLGGGSGHSEDKWFFLGGRGGVEGLMVEIF